MIVQLSADAQASVQQGATQLHDAMHGPVAQAIAARLAFWRSLQMSAAAAAGVAASPALLSQLLGAQLMQANAIADRNASSYAKLLAGLDSGALVLVAWSAGDERSPGPLQLGIARSDVKPGALGQWQVLPIVVRVASQVAIAAGAWILANAWTTSKELEAQASKTRADTSAKVAAAVTTLAKTDPGRAQALADALARAQSAADQAQPGLLDQLVGSLRDLTSGVKDSGVGLLLLGLLWMWSRRRERNWRRAA